MYQWLIDEINLVKFPNFHIIGTPLSKRDAKYVRESPLEVPMVYKEFVVTFNFAKLFCNGRDRYRIRLWSEPVYCPDTKYGNLECIGRYEMGTVYFKEEELNDGKDIPVHEWYGNSGIRKAADTFEEWIHLKVRSAKKKYKSKEWKELLVPPPPFNEREQAIITARHQMKWKLVRIEENLDRVIRVTNMSNMVLPYLTLDVKHADGSKFGGKFVPISDLLSGETKEYRFSLYEKYPDYAEQQLADARDPLPGEQKYYWEFR